MPNITNPAPGDDPVDGTELQRSRRKFYEVFQQVAERLGPDASEDALSEALGALPKAEHMELALFLVSRSMASLWFNKAATALKDFTGETTWPAALDHARRLANEERAQRAEESSPNTPVGNLHIADEYEATAEVAGILEDFFRACAYLLDVAGVETLGEALDDFETQLDP